MKIFLNIKNYLFFEKARKFKFFNNGVIAQDDSENKILGDKNLAIMDFSTFLKDYNPIVDWQYIGIFTVDHVIKTLPNTTVQTPNGVFAMNTVEYWNEVKLKYEQENLKDIAPIIYRDSEERDILTFNSRIYQKVERLTPTFGPTTPDIRESLQSIFTQIREGTIINDIVFMTNNMGIFLVLSSTGDKNYDSVYGPIPEEEFNSFSDNEKRNILTYIVGELDSGGDQGILTYYRLVSPFKEHSLIVTEENKLNDPDGTYANICEIFYNQCKKATSRTISRTTMKKLQMKPSRTTMNVTMKKYQMNPDRNLKIFLPKKFFISANEIFRRKDSTPNLLW